MGWRCRPWPGDGGNGGADRPWPGTVGWRCRPWPGDGGNGGADRRSAYRSVHPFGAHIPITPTVRPTAHLTDRPSPGECWDGGPAVALHIARLTRPIARDPLSIPAPQPATRSITPTVRPTSRLTDRLPTACAVGPVGEPLARHARGRPDRTPRRGQVQKRPRYLHALQALRSSSFVPRAPPTAPAQRVSYHIACRVVCVRMGVSNIAG